VQCGLQRGLILTSDPGVGKNTYAKMLARTCGMPFFHTSVSAWFEGRGFLHDVIQRMNAAFDQALAMAPSLLYWDEVSSLPKRDRLDSHNRDFWIPIIDGALIRLDGALSSESRRNVIVVAGTNDATCVDPALARPGRLERIVHIPRPDVAGIQNILRFHLDSDLQNEDLADVAVIAQGATGADLMALVRTARQVARHAGRPLLVADLREILVPSAGTTPGNCGAPASTKRVMPSPRWRWASERSTSSSARPSVRRRSATETGSSRDSAQRNLATGCCQIGSSS
jgi:cell division protease FtsH